MKKAVSVFVVILMMLSCCSCRSAKRASKQNTITDKKDEIGRINGVWISYIELDGMIASGNFEQSFCDIVKRCKSFKITDIFMHTAPFCDAYCSSDIYPLRKQDILKTAIDISHKNGIRLHAWINPYRIKTSDNRTDNLPEGSPAYIWLNDEAEENNKNILTTDSGVYLNPLEPEVRRTVIEFIRELCRKYDIDGIHFDDYFYPTPDAAFDEASYTEYKSENANPLSLGDYRRANVNALISGCYTAVKFIDKDIVFSISPAADIEKNREVYFADIAEWCKNGCVDIIIPQAYFGFCYPQEKFCFNNILDGWKKLLLGCDIRLCVGLAFYKTGCKTKPDCDEWAEACDIISRQTEICLNDGAVSGQVFYSVSSLFSDAELNTKARQNVESVLDIK